VEDLFLLMSQARLPMPRLLDVSRDTRDGQWATPSVTGRAVSSCSHVWFQLPQTTDGRIPPGVMQEGPVVDPPLASDDPPQCALARCEISDERRARCCP